MSRTEKLQSIVESIRRAGFNIHGMQGTLMGALNDAAEVGRCEVGHELNAERRHAGKLADAVGAFLDKRHEGAEDALRAALTRWVESGAPEAHVKGTER